MLIEIYYQVYLASIGQHEHNTKYRVLVRV